MQSTVPAGHTTTRSISIIMVSLFFTSAVLLPFFSTAVPDSSSPQDQAISSELLDVLVIGQQPVDWYDIKLVDEYDSFVHIRATSEVIEELDHLGLDIRPIQTLHQIEFDMVTFDTRQGEPEIPLGLRDDHTDLFIVQVRGPVKETWLERISTFGPILEPIKHHAYIVRMDPDDADAVSSLDFIDWVGRYHPFYRIRSGFEGLGDWTKANIIFFKDEPEAFEIGLGAVKGLGGKVLFRDDGTDWWNGARIEMPTNALQTLARLDGLDFIEPYDDPEPRMNKVRWVIQSYDADNELTPVWDNGINGTGIIVGGADTGIDRSHLAFRNSTSDVGAPGFDHRKIVQYNTTVDTWDDPTGHGTHTMGALVGNNVSAPGGYYYLDGVAYGARLAFYDVVLPSGTYDPPIMSDILMDAYKYGAHSHSDSWGDDTTAYTSRSQRIDQFQWDNYEFLTFIAPGNGGVVWEPATAKNCVSVGNTYNGENLDIAGSSAVGPANGNMINPHIVAPGMNLVTPRPDMNRTNSNLEYTPLSGTSMSTPVAAGASALVEEYFKDGFYPSGTNKSADGFTPSGPLKKAALINSAWSQFGGMKDGANIGHAPNNKQGWGKIKLDDVLYFDGDTKGLWIYDGYNESEGQGLKTGEKDTYIIHVNSSEPFEVTLVWNDFPGQGLKNDLDLTVQDPLGNFYRGNDYSQGESVTGGTADGSNPTETFLLRSPMDGFYIVNVTAIDIRAQVHQRYSLVVTGAMQGANNGDVNFDKALYGINDKVGVRVVDSDLNGQGAIEVKLSSLTETTPENLMLLESGIKGVFHGSMALSMALPTGDGVLQVSETDTIAVQYVEADPAGTRVDTAEVDAKPPGITNVLVTDITNTTAIVKWDTDESATSNVTYGPSAALGSEKILPDLLTEHSIQLTGLLPSTLYYFDVASKDLVGNQAVDDNGGLHHTFRTASFIISAEADYVGWVRQGENYNHFTDGIMYSGHFLNLTRHSAMLFNMTSIPDNADIVAASVRVYSRGGFGMSQTQGTWTMALLDPGVNDRFNGTSTEPNYNNINNAAISANMGAMDGPTMGLETWNTFTFSVPDLDLLEDGLAIDGAAFRIKGPSTGLDNMFSWDTGNTASANSLGEQFAPQLILTLNLIPIVQPGAPSDLTIKEDGNLKVDLGTVFTDDGPLRYVITQPPSNIDHNITNGTLNLTPNKDWNGEDYLIVKAIDNDDLYAEHRMNITVTPVNDPPLIISIGGIPVEDGMVLNATQGSPFSVNVVATDVDKEFEGDLLFYDVNVSRLYFEDDNLTFTPDNDDVGLHPISVSVRDIEGARASVEVIIDVANINDLPMAVISSPFEGHEGLANETVQFNASESSDIDLPFGDNLTYQWRSSVQGQLGEGMVIDEQLEAGVHKITLTVTDLDGATSLAEVNITIWGDTDGDGVYDPDDLDDDGDGMPDIWEGTYGLDPMDPFDAKGDLDDDGFSNLKEYKADTDPTDPKDKPKDSSLEGEWNPVLLYLLIFLVIGLLIGGYLVHSAEGKDEAEDDDIEDDEEIGSEEE